MGRRFWTLKLFIVMNFNCQVIDLATLGIYVHKVIWSGGHLLGWVNNSPPPTKKKHCINNHAEHFLFNNKKSSVLHHFKAIWSTTSPYRPMMLVWFVLVRKGTNRRRWYIHRSVKSWRCLVIKAKIILRIWIWIDTQLLDREAVLWRMKLLAGICACTNLPCDLRINAVCVCACKADLADIAAISICQCCRSLFRYGMTFIRLGLRGGESTTAHGQ